MLLHHLFFSMMHACWLVAFGGSGGFRRWLVGIFFGTKNLEGFNGGQLYQWENTLNSYPLMLMGPAGRQKTGYKLRIISW